MSTDGSLSPQQDLRDRFPWLIIGHSFKITLDFRVIVFAAAALVATVAGWRVLDGVFAGSDDEVLKQWAPRNSVEEGDDEPIMVPDRAWPWEEWKDEKISAAPSPRVPQMNSDWRMGAPLVREWHWLTKPAFKMFNPNIGLAGFVCLLLSILWAAAVWGLFAGAITRYAAVALTTGERLGWSQMFLQARARWLSYFSAPLIPIVAALLFAIPMLIAGWILHIPHAGPLLVGFGWFIAIIGGIVMAVTLVPPMFGWPFMWSTISTEGSDAMDGCSRCYSYVSQRPLRFISYLLFAGLLSGLGVMLVTFLVGVVESLSIWAVSWGAGNELMQEIRTGMDSDREVLTGLTGVGATLFGFWTSALRLVVPAFAFAFFFTSMIAIYLLLRFEIDSAELDEVFLEQPPEPLAPVMQDAAGVATVPPAEAEESSGGEETS